tara:strand:+ start:7657 stop:9006 length:1350 start_codon:yes stop_codon:yes gene_type:complete
MPSSKSVIIIGAGFSGTLVAVNILRHEGPRILLIEREAGIIARGIAYGRAGEQHLLNVRAENMSALPDDPTHFQRWLDTHGQIASDGFASRAVYGRYLRALLDDAIAHHPDRLTIVNGEATQLERNTATLTVSLNDGRQFHGDKVVLAQGNLPPHELPKLADLGSVYVADPWSGLDTGGLAKENKVLLIGAGLTAVDVSLSLESAGFEGLITCLSRRGLAPHAHDKSGPAMPASDRHPADGSQLIRHVRRRAAEIGWRTAVDELRPHMQDFWRRAEGATQYAYLNHLRPYWDIHRHRIAPQVEVRLKAMQARGALAYAAGKIVSAMRQGQHAEVVWRVRGTDELRQGGFARVINCTGPQGNLACTNDPLLGQLRDAGIIRPDMLNLGIDVAHDGCVISAAGRRDPDLFAIGPMTRGAFWEIVAVPDIRKHAWAIARRLSSAHWVEGGGL